VEWVTRMIKEGEEVEFESEGEVDDSTEPCLDLRDSKHEEEEVRVEVEDSRKGGAGESTRTTTDGEV
jgi:hypothetical protein